MPKHVFTEFPLHVAYRNNLIDEAAGVRGLVQGHGAVFWKPQDLCIKRAFFRSSDSHS